MQTRVIMAALVGLTVGILATSCDERPRRLDDPNVTQTVAVAALEGVRHWAATSSTRAAEPPAIDWSTIFVIEEEPVEVDEETEEPIEIAVEEELAAFTRYWSGVLDASDEGDEVQGETTVAQGTAEPALEDATDDEGLADEAPSGTDELPASDQPALAEVDLSWVDEELNMLHERVAELERQVERQQREIDTLAMAMAVQARRVTANQTVTAQLAAAMAVRGR